MNKKTKSKTQNKKITDKKKIKEKNKKPLMYVIGALVLLIIIVIIVLMSFPRKTKILCEYSGSNKNGITQNSFVSFVMKKDSLSEVKEIKEFVLDDDKKNTYLSILEATLDEVYKNTDYNYSVTKEENKIIVSIEYKSKDKFVFDNVDIMLENEGISVNVISEDNTSNREVIKLSEKNDVKNIKKLFKNHNYVCN